MWEAIIAVLIFAAIFTLWTVAVGRWKKWSGGCGSCSMLHNQNCCQGDGDEACDRPGKPTKG